MKYRLQKENVASRMENESRIFIDAENIEEVKEYLIKNDLEFIRYSNMSDTVYYKGV